MLGNWNGLLQRAPLHMPNFGDLIMKRKNGKHGNRVKKQNTSNANLSLTVDWIHVKQMDSPGTYM